MRYKIIEQELREETLTSLIISSGDESFVSFPAVVGNPNYDQFLTQTGLTDAEVHELEPDVWYDFPQKEEE